MKGTTMGKTDGTQTQMKNSTEKIGGKVPAELAEKFKALCTSPAALTLHYNATDIHRMCIMNGIDITEEQLKRMVVARNAVK